MNRLFVTFLLYLTLASCSPESGFLNSSEKREVARQTEEKSIPLLDSLEGRCIGFQDSLQPYLIDSIMAVRIEGMRKKLEQQ